MRLVLQIRSKEMITSVKSTFVSAIAWLKLYTFLITGVLKYVGMLLNERVRSLLWLCQDLLIQRLVPVYNSVLIGVKCRIGLGISVVDYETRTRRHSKTNDE